jgi:tellurite resistance protein TerC
MEPRLDIHIYTWVVTIAVLAVILIADFLIAGRKPHVPTTKETLEAFVLYVALACIFGLGLWFFTYEVHGHQMALEYFSGFLTEKSLSIDNLFIFLVIFEKQRVPKELERFALMIGIFLAMVLRGLFIAAGATVINQFAWVFFLFGVWLLHTAWGLLSDFRAGKHDDESAAEGGAVTKWLKKKLRSTEDWEGERIFVRRDGKIMVTLMFFLILTLETTDVMFALDSIPAIFGLTNEPYIVFTANMFALMGLRQLYFLIGDLLDKFYYLPVGLTILLTFIGVKLILHAMNHYGWDEKLFGIEGEIPTSVSLLAIVGILAITIAASVFKAKRESKALANEVL